MIGQWIISTLQVPNELVKPAKQLLALTWLIVSGTTALAKCVVGSTLNFAIVLCIDFEKLQLFFMLKITISKFWCPLFYLW